MKITAQFRRFKLSKDFLKSFKRKQPKWGPLGYITYKSRYARRKPDGGTEEFWETLERVVEGIFNIQKRHCASMGLEWNNTKSQKTAQEMYTAMWEFKFLPPGRGLWMAGTPYVEERTGMGLFNCSMVSTEDIDRLGARPFEFIMDGLMLGVGMGFDTKGEGKVVIQEPIQTDSTFIISDSREGWVESTGIIIQGYFSGSKLPLFDYGNLRKEGEPLKGFGGVSSGPAPLVELHKNLVELFDDRIGDSITSSDIVDIENYISKCVIAGNIRRSAAIALGRHDDQDFMELKHDQEKLKTHRYGSNNSIFAEIGMDYNECAENTIKQGEPGLVWLENLRNFGRFVDGKKRDDRNVAGVNPCGEQQLESFEMCCLVETFPINHDSLEDYLHTSYKRIKKLDAKYSDWLCVPRSKRVTSVKPSGTVSLLPGVTPGIHYPEAEYYIRRIRFEKSSALLPPLKEAGFKLEQDYYNKNSIVVDFPVKEDFFERTKYEVTMWEQMEFAAKYQHYWSDNAVSITVTFKPEEAQDIKHALSLYEDRLKVVSFLPLGDHGYKQAPYEAITKEKYNEMKKALKKPNLRNVQTTAIGEKYCDGDKCEV